MTRNPANPDSPKSRGLQLLEYVILSLLLCIIALRSTIVEGPPMRQSAWSGNVGDIVYSLSLSALIILAFLAWLVWSFCGRRFTFRLTGIEIGLLLLCLAGVISGLGAPDKRQAISDAAVFLGPPLLAILLVQILDSRSKVMLVLAVVAALGIVSAFEGVDQLFVSNPMTIEQYKEDPNVVLDQLPVEATELNRFLFEHRLHSAGVRAFFTTRNSAGCFLLMALAAVAALLVRALRRGQLDVVHLVACCAAAAAVLLGLSLTLSKGAIIGLLLAAGGFGAYLGLGAWLKAHRRGLLIGCLVFAVVAVGLVVSYGLRHDRLPGGSSMLVRWQYWRAAAQMYFDYPLAGVGPGNFAHFYTHYKPAGALEAVADPHNFALSILTQYGPLGLAGFVAMIGLPLWLAGSFNAPSQDSKKPRKEPSLKVLSTRLVIVISAVLLFVRGVLMPFGRADSIEVLLYVVFKMYVTPAAVFVIAFVFLTMPMRRSTTAKSGSSDAGPIAAVLFCGILGMLVHNLIDFAIFEPGVLTVLWVLFACLIATCRREDARNCLSLRPGPIAKVAVVAAACLAAGAYLSFVLVPAAACTSKVRGARRATSLGRFEQAHQLLKEAAHWDRLSSAPLSADAGLYYRQYKDGMAGAEDLLRQARVRLLAAMKRSSVTAHGFEDRRNSPAFKDFEKLTEVCLGLAETSASKRDDWLRQAFEACSRAIERYPGCARLQISLAQIAEQLGEGEAALVHYSRAVEIEDAYREQFEQIYPKAGRVVSRLGEEKYQLAKRRIESLSKRPGQ